MIQTKIYSQRDARWRDEKLGFGRTTIGSDGCVITSLAMLLSALGYDETPSTVNKKLKAVGGFVQSYIIWGRAEKAWDRLRFVKLANEYSNAEVSWSIYAKGMPVIVKVNAPQIGARFGHWVLYVGDRKLVDPFDGKVKPTSTYAATKYSLYARK